MSVRLYNDIDEQTAFLLFMLTLSLLVRTALTGAALGL